MIAANKSPEAFRSISEASDELGVPQHVLRFWESRFSFIRPMKRAGGRRFYRPQDLAVLKGVRTLLHEQGYTIKGVQRLHKEQGVRHLLQAGGGPGAPMGDAMGAFESGLDASDAQLADRNTLESMLEALEAAKTRLDALLERTKA